MSPGYLGLYDSGELDRRIEELQGILESCVLCPRGCGVNRLEGELGYCRAGENLMVSSISPHFGEEDPLVGPNRFAREGGSGTVFLSNCNLYCVYCQNYEISHLGMGSTINPEDLARRMIGLQERGCYNINFVTPTHYTPQLVESIREAIPMGLEVPIVYNCGGYESVETLQLLDGIIDIYMPDFKYGGPGPAREYSDASDYFERCKEAVLEMHRQVGDLQTGERGVAQKGLLVRHLVLPNDQAESQNVLEFLAKEVSKDTYVNIMFQYRPTYEASEHEEISRGPTMAEYNRVIRMAGELGLHRGFQQRGL